jgi:hypothetical protein
MIGMSSTVRPASPMWHGTTLQTRLPLLTDQARLVTCSDSIEQVDLETGSDGKRKDSLDVTALPLMSVAVLGRPCNRISSSELASDLLWTSHLPSVFCSCAESQDLSNVRLLPRLALFRVHISGSDT